MRRAGVFDGVSPRQIDDGPPPEDLPAPDLRMTPSISGDLLRADAMQSWGDSARFQASLPLPSPRGLCAQGLASSRAKISAGQAGEKHGFGASFAFAWALSLRGDTQALVVLDVRREPGPWPRGEFRDDT
mmetsp:Transcript_31425/g.74953  ORF Transcript_31425/g.74953 Transcript_31425/m.74953 type:complete len:130 (-) Transcript_31425:148-537(-)